MKQVKLWMLVAILAFCCTGTVRAQYPGPFLTDETRPNGIFFLPEPPKNVKDSIGGRFYNDRWYYQWGKSVRDDYAVRDEGVELLSDEGEGVFNDIIGLEPGEKAPEILYLAQAATSDVHVATKALKKHYKCLRPFAFFGEPSITPDQDEELAREWGYPSGHAARGWMFAYVLSQVAPDRANDLARRANAYGMNRVVFGHHLKSDVDAGQMLAAVIFATVSATEAYQKQLKKARREYKRVKRQKGVLNDSIHSQTLGFHYDLLSSLLKSLPDKGLSLSAISTNASCANDGQTTYTGHIVDVVQQRIYDGEITVEDGIISDVRECALPEDKDFPYIMPGFIDSHVHIESSMILPQEFAKAAVCHGTIGCMSDPHEIGNVLGVDGVRFMIEQSRRTPFNILWGAPSCVPSLGGEVETSGAVIDSKGVAELMAMAEIGYLSEMMDYVGVLNHDAEVMAKIKAAHDVGKPVDGHAPGLMGEQRRQYAQAGITTDHECSNTDEGRQCIEAGMKLLIREGSAAKNYLALCPLIDEYPDEVMFCTDDYNPKDLLQGHINLIVKRALADGYDFWNVMKAASLNPQRHYGQHWGLLQKGDPATFILTDSVTSDFHVLKTVLKGEVVFDCQSDVTLSSPHSEAAGEALPNHFVATPITATDITLDPQCVEAHNVIVASDGSLLTGREILHSAGSVQVHSAGSVQVHSAGSAQVQTVSDNIQKIVVYNRYQKGVKPVVGLISGFHLTHGAMASSVAHDCHNIVAIGSKDEDIVRAVNRVIEMRGGQVAIAGDKLADLALPIAGLMSPLPVEQVAQQSLVLHEVVREAGCDMSAPFITMAFMCLPVIPELKITDKCLWDSKKMERITYSRPATF